MGEVVVAKVLDNPLEAEAVMGNHLAEEPEGNGPVVVGKLEVDDVVDLRLL